MKLSEKSVSAAASASLLFAAVLWGSGFVVTQMAIDSKFSTLLIMALRFILASAIMLPFVWKSVASAGKDGWLRGMLAGVLLFLGFLFQTMALLFTTPSNNAFITSVNVVLVPFISWLLLRRRPKLRVFLLAGLSLCGIAILSLNPGEAFSVNPGDALTLLCAVAFAAHIAYLEIATRSMELRALVFIQMLTAGVLSVLALLIFDRGAVAAADFASGLPAVIYLAVFPTCVSFFLQTFAQKHTTSAKAAIFMSSEAVVGATLSVLLGMEPMTVRILLGGAIILAAVVLMEQPFGRKSRLPQLGEEPVQ